MPRLGRAQPIGMLRNYQLNETPAVEIGLATETDTALALTHYKTVRLGIVTQTTTALALTVVKTVRLGIPSETDSTFALVGDQSVLLGLVTETDTALAISRRKTVPLGVVFETDSALPLSYVAQATSLFEMKATYDALLELPASYDPLLSLEASRMGTRSPISKSANWFTGEDQTFQWTTITNGVPDDISTWAIQFRMSLAPGQASVLTKSATLTTPTSGIFRVVAAAADTSGLTAQKYYYTASRTDSGFNQVLAFGDAFLQGRVV